MAAPAADEEDARSLQAELRRRHHDATHHVMALRLDQERVRWDDDGEPAGTAGRPALRALRRAELWRTVVVIVRWYGGTKLGTGGLARAYGEAAGAAASVLPVRDCVPGRRVRVRFPYDATGSVMQLASAAGARRRSADYGEATELLLDVPASEVEALVRRLGEATAGRADSEILDGRVLVPVASPEGPPG